MFGVGYADGVPHATRPCQLLLPPLPADGTPSESNGMLEGGKAVVRRDGGPRTPPPGLPEPLS